MWKKKKCLYNLRVLALYILSHLLVLYHLAPLTLLNEIILGLCVAVCCADPQQRLVDVL